MKETICKSCERGKYNDELANKTKKGDNGMIASDKTEKGKALLLEKGTNVLQTDTLDDKI